MALKLLPLPSFSVERKAGGREWRRVGKSDPDSSLLLRGDLCLWGSLCDGQEEFWGDPRDSTEGRALALHVPDPHSIPGRLYDP